MFTNIKVKHTYLNTVIFTKIIQRSMMSSGGAGKQPMNTPKNSSQVQHNNKPDISMKLSEEYKPPITEIMKQHNNDDNQSYCIESSNEYSYEPIKPKTIGESKTVEYFWADFKNTSMNMKYHEKQHSTLVEKKEDGTTIAVVYATSQKSNPITNTKNLDFGPPQINVNKDLTKVQRFSTYANPRLFDSSVKEGIHYDKDKKANAYYQGLSETRKAELENLANKGSTSDKPNHMRIYVHRTSPDATSRLNDMGYEEEQEYTKTDFHDIQNHD